MTWGLIVLATENAVVGLICSHCSFYMMWLCRWLQMVETVGRQYAFIKFGTFRVLSFACVLEIVWWCLWLVWRLMYGWISLCMHVDRVIQKKRREYSDPNSSLNTKKINDDLQSIHTIMRKTIDDVLDRGSKLDGECVCVWWWVYTDVLDKGR